MCDFWIYSVYLGVLIRKGDFHHRKNFARTENVYRGEDEVLFCSQISVFRYFSDRWSSESR